MCLLESPAFLILGGLLGKGPRARNDTNVKYDSVWMGTPTGEHVIVMSLFSP